MVGNLYVFMVLGTQASMSMHCAGGIFALRGPKHWTRLGMQQSDSLDHIDAP